MGFGKGNHKKFTKRNEILSLTKQNETKRNFAVFFVSRNKRNFAKQFVCFALFRVSRNKKRMRNGNPYLGEEKLINFIGLSKTERLKVCRKFRYRTNIFSEIHRWARHQIFLSPISDIDIALSDIGKKFVGLKAFSPISDQSDNETA
jgi:hypothetical protein